MSTIKILLLAANPSATSRLHLDEEIREIERKIREAEYRDNIRLVPGLAARPDDLLLLLNQHKPDIVHFSGHGDRSGQIIMQDEEGRMRPVEPDVLARVFRTLKDRIRLVVFNAC